MLSRLNDVALRVLMALFAFLLLLIVSLSQLPYLFPVCIFLILLLLCWEYLSLFSLSHRVALFWQCLFGVIALFLIMLHLKRICWVEELVIVLSSFVWIFVLPILLLGGSVEHIQRIPLYIHMTWLFIALYAFAAALLNLHQSNIIQFFVVWSIVWIMDSAAYFWGRWIGRYPLSPLISPKKTIEGSLAAFCTLMILFAAAGVLSPSLFGWVLHAYFLVSLAIAAFVSVIGDLFESALKRMACVKDSGKIMPGHGGLFDRLDSIVAVFPVFYLLIRHV